MSESEGDVGAGWARWGRPGQRRALCLREADGLRERSRPERPRRAALAIAAFLPHVLPALARSSAGDRLRRAWQPRSPGPFGGPVARSLGGR